MFWGEPTRRKSRKQKAREKGKKSYRKGSQYERQAYAFLGRRGFSVLEDRVRFKGGEFDGVAAKDGRKYAIEAKNTKQKVGVNVVKRLEKKIAESSGTVKAGIIVSRSGFTEEALSEQKKSMLLFIYKPKRRKREEGWTW